MSTSSRLRGIFSSLPCVGGHENENLTMAQKELLLWHWRLGIGMQRIQTMMRNRTFEDLFGRMQLHPPIIKSKFASTASCTIPRCQSCELSRAHHVGAFMADLAGRRSVLFPKIQREAGRYEIFGEERSLYEVLVWEAFPHVL